MDYRKITLFLLLAFTLSILGWYLPGWFLEADNLFLPNLRVALYSWGPALAALIVHRQLYQGSMRRYGWNRKHFSLRWIALAMAMPVLVILGSLGLVYLLGEWLHLPGFGEIVLGAGGQGNGTLTSLYLSTIPDLIALGLPPEIGSVLLIIALVSIVGGATVSLIWLSGQELGWRGFMLVETRSLGFLGSNLIIGALWGLWLFPLFLFQQPDLLSLDELAWHFLATIGFGIAAAFPAAWLAIRSRSIYASATFLGVFNNLAPLALFFTYDGHPLIASPQGLAGMLVLMLITFLIIRFDKGMTEGYDKWVF